MESLGKIAEEMGIPISCVPKGFEDYMSFGISMKHKLPWGKTITYKIKFIDSLQFLTSSLANLANNLLGEKNEGQERFRALGLIIDNSEKRQLMLRKGVYPYEYVDSLARLEDRKLPPKECFKDTLRGEELSQDDYNHAKNCWRVFGCQTLGDYTDEYLRGDVLLLTDVFENFREQCMQYYGLDPAHYISLPSFAWDACLSHTKVELDLIHDPDMYAFFENSIRGGISMICGRYAKANNPNATHYDPHLPLSHILYLDAVRSLNRCYK